jgi:hypothetical protein
VLKRCLAGIVLCFAVLIAPALVGQQTGQLSVVKIKSSANASAVVGGYGVTLIDSIPELNKYLVQGTAANLASLQKDSNVQGAESNLAAQISEFAILNESTVALLDPDAVALLLDQTQTWDGHHWVKSSVFQQPALQIIAFTPSTTPGSPVTVAVIDTGIDPLHPALQGSTLPGHNFINEQGTTNELNDLDPATASLLQQRSGLLPASADTLAVLNPSTVALLDSTVLSLMKQTPTPYFGHGTMVSGLIHAVDPSALILPLKVFDATGRGTSFRIAKAIVYATNNGASVINMSFSMDSYSDLINDAVKYATHNNVILVASVGNTDLKIDRIYPASSDKVIGVASTDQQDQKADFSNYGPVADVSAPGVGLISPYPAGLYALWSGTSASAALVSGEAALLFSQTNLHPGDVFNRIGSRVDHLHLKYPLGSGRINLRIAMQK